MRRRLFHAAVLLAGTIATLAGGAVATAAQEVAVITTRVIYPNEPVPPDALKEVGLNRRPSSSTAIVTTLDQIEGKVARRTILPRRLIPVSSLREAYLVESGEPVTVKFVQGALSISARAVPLQSGSAGDVVKLRNVDSGATLTGVVMDDGTVRIGAT